MRDHLVPSQEDPEGYQRRLEREELANEFKIRDLKVEIPPEQKHLSGDSLRRLEEVFQTIKVQGLKHEQNFRHFQNSHKIKANFMAMLGQAASTVFFSSKDHEHTLFKGFQGLPDAIREHTDSPVTTELLRHLFHSQAELYQPNHAEDLWLGYINVIGQNLLMTNGKTVLKAGANATVLAEKPASFFHAETDWVEKNVPHLMPMFRPLHAVEKDRENKERKDQKDREDRQIDQKRADQAAREHDRRMREQQEEAKRLVYEQEQLRLQQLRLQNERQTMELQRARASIPAAAPPPAPVVATTTTTTVSKTHSNPSEKKDHPLVKKHQRQPVPPTVVRPQEQQPRPLPLPLPLSDSGRRSHHPPMTVKAKPNTTTSTMTKMTTSSGMTEPPDD